MPVFKYSPEGNVLGVEGNCPGGGSVRETCLLDTCCCCCRRRCCAGVISDPQTAPSTSSSSSSSVLSFVSTVWINLHHTKTLSGVDVRFVPVRRQDNMTMDTLLEGMWTHHKSPVNISRPFST